MSVTQHIIAYWFLAVLVAGAIALFLHALRRHVPWIDRFVADAAGEQTTELTIEPNGRDRWAWWTVGVCLLAAAYATLETRQHYYFVQDDAMVSELPCMLQGCRSVWAGIWPDYDPVRCMGGPLAGTGLPSLTYPPTFLAYAIARHLLHNEYALLDVFAAMHLLAGYCIMFGLCQAVGMRPSLASAGALSFMLSGGVLIMGRSWHAFVPIVVWLPLLIYSLHQWGRTTQPMTWRWALGTGSAAGAFYHVGFPQLWMYTVLLLSVAVVSIVIAQRMDWRRLLPLLSAGLIAAGTMLPLVLTQVAAAAHINRPQIYGVGITRQWVAAFLPYPLISIQHPMGWGSTDIQYMGHFVYFGCVFAILILAGGLLMLGARRTAWGKNPWLLAAIVAFLLTTGAPGGIFTLIAHVPLLRTVNNNPFRALPIFVCFAVIGSGIVCERSMRSHTVAARIAGPLAVVTIILLAQHIWMVRPPFYSYGFQPYPTLPANLAKRVQGNSGRVVSWSPLRSIEPSFAAAMPANLPMIYDIPAFGGYDPVLECNRSYLQAADKVNADPLTALRAYGVRWHLLSPLMADPVFSPNPGQREQETTVRNRQAFLTIYPNLKRIVNLPTVRLEELGDTAPLAFTSDRPAVALPLTAAGNGFAVHVHHSATQQRTLILNYLWWPQMRATVDSKPASCRADTWGRIQIALPDTAKVVRVWYAGGWLTGVVGGGACIIMGILISALTSSRNPLGDKIWSSPS